MAGLLFTFCTYASDGGDVPHADDSDLSPPREVRIPIQVPLDLEADDTGTAPLSDPTSMEIEVFREFRGNARPVMGLTFEVPGQQPTRAVTGVDGVARFSDCRACLLYTSPSPRD